MIVFCSTLSTAATIAILISICLGKPDEKVIKLGKHSTFHELITLSGFGSGGGFAQQLQFSYSSLFKGIAVFQHAFYRCGRGDGIAVNYDQDCTIIDPYPRDVLYDPENSLKDIREYFGKGIIEDPKNLAKTKLYVYTGTHNWVHTPDISLKILNVYETWIKDPKQIMIRAQAANLTLPTNHYGGSCAQDATDNYFLSNCGLSGPFEALLAHLVHHKRIALQPLLLFNQTEFTKDIQGEHLMDTAGFLYVPARCKYSKCVLHLYFHGCTSGREFVGANHIQNSGFLEIAELNSIIMLFPQAMSNTGENGWGCWDTYGITGKLYATKQGAQVQAVRNMILRILGQDGNAHAHASESNHQTLSSEIIQYIRNMLKS